MSDMTKTKSQLIQELETLRRRVDELENKKSSHAHHDAGLKVSHRPQLLLLDPELSIHPLREKIEKIEQTLARRIREMTALYEISLDITAELGEADILNKIIEQAARLLETQMGRIYLLPDEQQQLELVGSYHCSETWSDVAIAVGEGVSGHVVTSGEPVIVANYSEWEGRVDALSDKIGRILGVPLKRGPKIIGVLVVFDGPEKQGAFKADDVKLLNMLAAQVAIALENSQLYSTMQYKVEELATLNRVSQAVNSTLDLQETLTLITDHIMLQLGASAASVVLYDSEQNVLRFAAVSGKEAGSVLGKQLAVGQGVIGWVAQHGQPVLVPDVSQDNRFYSEFDNEHDFLTRSIVGVPLQIRGQTTGVIAAINKANGSIFTEEDMQLLALIAAPAATAIENARLYNQSQQKISALQQAEAEIAQRARQLELINDIGRQIAAELELDLLLDRAAHLVQQYFDYHHVALFLIEGDLLKLKAVAGSYEDYFSQGHTQRLEEGINGWVARNGEKLIANDVSQEARYTSLIREHSNTRSELCLPIKVKDDTVGVVDIQSPALHAFNDNDVVAMETVTNQIAVAIRNARLYQQAKQELSDREQFEQELRASEERFRQVITSISDHIYVSEVTEVGERINYYHSPNVEHLTGYPVEKFAQDWHFWPSALIHPDDRSRAAAQAAELSQGHNSEVEYRLMRADGTIMWVRDSARVETKNQHQTIYGVVADITERKQRSHELEIIVAIADTLRSTATRSDIISKLLDQLLDLLYMAGAAMVTYSTALAKPVVEQTSGVWAGVKEEQLLSIDDDQNHLFSQDNLYVNNDIQNDPEISWPDAFDVVKAIAIVPLSIQDEFVGALVVGHRQEITADIVPLLTTISNMAVNALRRASLFEALQRSNHELANERALLAQRVEERTAELRAANTELARAARLKDEFMANMSHELRTPLNAILGMSEILRTNVYGVLNDEQLNAVNYIEEGGSHLLSLINDILDLSKIEAGKLDLLISPVSASEICQTALQLVKPLAQQKQMKLVRSYDSSVDLIMVDERRLKQILVNLLTNAVKFSPEGSRIGLELEGDAAQGVVHFIVWDNGIGISVEDMQRLFKPFVQIDSGLTRHQEGTGLGLSLVYRLTEMHGGSVKLESEVDHGSCFTISLPWLHSDDTVQPTAEEQVCDTEPEAASQRINLLLAEANEDAIDAICTTLQPLGYNVTVIGDGVEAVKLASEMRPEVILMDVQLPGISGSEAIRQIRQNHQHLASTPIIALTALSIPGDRQRCIDAGATEYLRKPVSPSRLVTLLESSLKKPRGGLNS